MKCINCGEGLVYREVREFPINEAGVFDGGDGPEENDTVAGLQPGIVVCTECAALHAFEIIHLSGDYVTVALVKGDPTPAHTIVGADHMIYSNELTGLVFIDKETHQVVRMLAIRDTAFIERAYELAGNIPKGEWQAKYD